MARLALIMVLLIAFVAIVAIIVVSANARIQANAEARRSIAGPRGQLGGSLMASNSFQKIAYIALIVLLFGVTTGWLGGL